MAFARAGVLKEECTSAVVASANAHFRRHILKTLQFLRRPVEEARGGAEALAKVEAGGCETLLLDRWLPDLDVDELVAIVKARYPQVEVLVMDSEDGNSWLGEELSQRLRAGELSAILPHPGKPVGQSTVSCVEPVPTPTPSRPRQQEEPLPGMIGSSEGMQRAYRLARLVVPRDTPVLVTGETGTGKDLVARAIHELGPRAKQPFVVVNCAAIPETLLEAELFGYSRGAFTGAFQSRLGRIHSAHGGTLLLDEVGEMPSSMQAKLLRFLQEGEVQRLGSPDVFRVDVRVIASTNADLARRIREGRFREDLYYRLAVFPIDLVPLRSRAEDIFPLAAHFLSLFCLQAGVAPKTFTPAASQLLARHNWPGNVRELRHLIERAFILAQDELEIRPEFLNFSIVAN